MKKKINEIQQKAESILKNMPCDYAEIRIASSVGTSIQLSGEKTDSFVSGESAAGSVRILKNGVWGFVAFNDLNELEKFASRGLRISAVIETTQKTEILKSTAINKSFKNPVKKNPADISLDEKFQLISSYNKILKSSNFIQTTRATYVDRQTNYVYLNSEGSSINYDKTYSGISLVSIAKDGTVIQPFHDSISGYGGYEIVENQEAMAEKVLKTAIDLLKAESVTGGTYNVIVDPKLAGVFIHEAFGHLSEADFIHENSKMKSIMKLGERFGPDGLNVTDDGTIENLSGYIPFDDEGILPQRTSLISEGILSGRLHSRETASVMGEETTGNARAISVMKQPIVRMTNTCIENGNYSKEEIFNTVKDGIYAVDVIGGQTNLEMFTFTSGYGYEIKNGKPGKMFKDIVLSGNVFSTLKNIAMIGNDKQMFGGLGGCGKGGQSPLPVSFGGPHMLIENVLIGGKQ